MITKEQLEEWIKLREKSYMSRKLPKCFILQDNINEMLGLDKDTYDGNGIRTMDLDRDILLKLNLAILNALVLRLNE